MTQLAVCFGQGGAEDAQRERRADAFSACASPVHHDHGAPRVHSATSVQQIWLSYAKRAIRAIGKARIPA